MDRITRRMSNSLKDAMKDKSFALALRIVKLNKYLTQEKKEFIISKQIIRSGTAPGALVREAQNAESKADFIHKLSVAQKECDETLYWLELLQESGTLDDLQFESISSDALELLKMLRSAIITTRQNMRKRL